MTNTTSETPTPQGVQTRESAFVRLGDIFETAGMTVDLLAPYPPLPDPDSPRERYRRATIERALREVEDDGGPLPTCD